jgi:hypothetical protein
MNSVLKIFAVVVVYSLVETVLLLSWVLPTYVYPSPTPWQWFVFCSQFVLIPGMAAFFSRIVSGPFHFRRRFLFILGIGLLSPIAAFLLVIVIAFPLVWAGSIHIALLLAVLVAQIIGFAYALRLLIRSTGRRSIEVEAAIWLAERQSGCDPSERRRSSRAICWALWIPAFTILLTFLFLPEAWGVLSHLYRRQIRTANLGGYHVPIPLTWVLINEWSQSNGESSASGLIFRGIGIKWQAYLHVDPPLSWWVIRIEQAAPTREPRHIFPTPHEIIGQRTFTIGNESITCVEYWPLHSTRPLHIEDSTAFVDCAGSKRFYASIVGEKTKLPAFYNMLEHITRQ